MCHRTADLHWSTRNVAAAAAGTHRQLVRIAASLGDAPEDMHAAAADLTRQAAELAAGARRLQHRIEAET